MVVNMLTEKKEILPDFSVEYFTSDDGRLGGLFWADENAKRNYFVFGDVVAFDATYRTNKYDMVFIPFTGIDNHGRCVTFGAGLLSKENVFSYRWLLSSFKKAFPYEPMLLLTDQDPAMKIAIQEVFDDAKHRLCMWHITQKVSSKVSVAAINAGFKEQLGRIVWTDKLSPIEFDIRWTEIIEDFGLQDNRWLRNMFDIRHCWVPAYFRNWRMSGLMRTSSRSESENHMFGQLMNSSSTIVEFFSRFDTAMDAQRFKQSKNDHESNYTSPVIGSEYGFDTDAQNLYTRSVYFDVQKEINVGIHKCMSMSVSDGDGIKVFRILDTTFTNTTIDNTIDRVAEPNFFDEYFPRESEVRYKVLEEEFDCSCLKFERLGVLCRHIFYVLRILNFTHFPKKYVCKRWTRNCVPPKSFRGRDGVEGSVTDAEDVSDIIRQIGYNVDLAIEKLVHNKPKMKEYLKQQKELLAKIDAKCGPCPPVSKDEMIAALTGLSKPDQIDVLPPIGVRNKGSGKRKRLVSAREQAIMDSNKSRRKCKYCKGFGHDKRNCEISKQHLLEKKSKKSKNADVNT